MPAMPPKENENILAEDSGRKLCGFFKADTRALVRPRSCHRGLNPTTMR